mmetsp:Transcript_85784/g.125544  ORF Transcript_85784/g.125544 Transcript_85784/m.125544 type:complete len:87 (-) Transcript_85784:946-1206(-)
MNSSGEREREKEEREKTVWCVQVCCQKVAFDMSGCYEDVMSSVRCRAPPTMRCAGLACCVMYCGLMAAGILALMALTPNTLNNFKG